MTRVRVIGCGNPDAGDDAVGLLAVREARSRLEAIPGVEVVETAAALNAVHLLEGVAGAVVVDAVRTPGGGRAPGEIVRVQAGPDGLPAWAGTSLSSHGLGLGEAVALLGALGGAPRVVLLGVEVADVTAGHSLSAPVSAVLSRLVELVVAETEGLAETVGP